jgi:hypothetical protein
MKAEHFIEPGDCLLYRPKGIFGWVIAMKTWHKIGHVEIYVGSRQSVASRDGIGVGLFSWRASELCAVLRPNKNFQMLPALDIFNRKYRGQGYDVMGLFRFEMRAPVDKVRFNNKQFCSEFATRFYRAGLLDPFNGEDADAIAPFQFLLSPVFTKYDVTVDGNMLEALPEKPE